MPFILELPCTAASSRLDDMPKWSKIAENHASEVKSDSFDGALYAEHNGVSFVTISEILMD